MKKTTYYLIGIGGISMSGIALYLHNKGNRVLGSDIQENEQTKYLQEKEITIHTKQDAININNDIDVVIYTSAVEKIDSVGYVELDQAKKLNIKVYKRSEFLGKLFNNTKLIAVAGTHGKTTTTGMLSKVLIDSKLDPTVFIGTTVQEFKNTNIRIGRSNISLLEACEYDRSFLDFTPDIAVITNIEEEHLDYFTNGISEIRQVFKSFIQKIKPNGTLIVYKDKNTDNILSSIIRKDIQIIRYAQNTNSDILNKIDLKIIGDHNKSNALATYFVAKQLNIADKQIFLSLSNFQGITRRGELIFENNQIKIFDDYAHHPTEIQTTLKGFRYKYPNNNIICIFQPHQHSRTKLLFSELSKSFTDCNQLIVLPIYTVVGREEKKKIDSRKLVQEIQKNHTNVIYMSSFQNTCDYLLGILKNNDIVISMGAGDIYKVSKCLKTELINK